MLQLEEILAIAGGALSLLVSLVTFILKYVGSERAKRGLERTVKIAEVVRELIQKAEAFTHFTGEEKREYVLTLAHQYALQAKLDFDREAVSAMIDEWVAVTKRVNVQRRENI